MTSSGPGPRTPVTLLDGATGTELSRRGHPTRLPLWSARSIAEAPDALEAIHRDYVSAGADILTAATFRTHERSLVSGGWGGRGDALNLAACDAARRARATNPEVRIAGSIAPLEDCFRPDLVPDPSALAAEHARQARSLAAAGVELILIETMNTRREAEAAIRASRATDLPVWCSWVTDGTGRLLSGEPLGDAVREAIDLGAEAVLVNCLPTVMIPREVELLARSADGQVPYGAYGNIGHANDVDGWRVELMLSPVQFAALMLRCRELGATLLGGCCGTQPEHIAALAAALQAEPAAP